MGTGEVLVWGEFGCMRRFWNKEILEDENLLWGEFNVLFRRNISYNKTL